MIDETGFFDWAISDPGPPERVLSGQRMPVSVYVCHSMEGTYAYGKPGAYIALRDGTRFPTAWHWSKLRDGRVCQHYPVWAHLQHAHAANVLGPGGEAEGFEDEPLTAAQVAADVRIIGDINAWRTKRGLLPLARDTRDMPQGTKRGLVEHREMGGTECPSERYAPLWAALKGDDDMPDPRVDKILQVLGAAQIDKWIADGDEPLLDAFEREQKARGAATNAINAHIREHPTGGPVPEHIHEAGRVIR